MPVPSLDEARTFFRRTPFIADLGVGVDAIDEGECQTSLAIAQRFLQHSGQVHAGVLTTIADHTAGAAAQTLAPEGVFAATAELKLSLLRPARGERIVCRARVLKPGKSLSFVEADVFCAAAGGDEQLVARMSATMAFINVRNLV
ncbi:MAG: PaaI family thioesterase [Ideonella sp.]|nr:PaaI family thioesterase [Ideonella sp.]